MRNVAPGESAMVRSLFSLNFLVIFAFTLTKAARDGLFLSAFPARTLPYIYIGLAVWTILAMSVYGRTTARFPSHRSLTGGLAGGGAVLLLFFAWFRAGLPAGPILLYLWAGAAGLILVTQFWSLANERINPRQARRLFGIGGGGGILGGLVGGAVVSQAGRLLPPEWFLLPAAFAQTGAALIARRSGQRRDETPPALQDREEDEYVGVRTLLRQPYIRLLAAIFLIGGVTSAIVEYQFKLLLQQFVAGSAPMTGMMNAAETSRITTLVGYFYGAQSLIALAVQISLTGLILSRLGARAASFLRPGGLLIGSIAAVGAPGILPVAATWLYDTVLQNSIARSTREFLYFPLARGIRRQARRLMEAVIGRSAEGAAGLIILALNRFFDGSTVQLAGLVALLAVVYLLLERLMNRAYLSELSSSLRWMILPEESSKVSYGEAGLVQELHSLLDSRYEKRALYALNTLVNIDPDGLNERLPDLLQHPSSLVRARSLELSADQCITTDMSRVKPLLQDRDDDVRLHAAFFYCQLAPGDPYSEMGELLKSESARVRSGAFQCVAAHSPPEGDEQVEMLTKQFLERGEKVDRLAVARGAGRRPPPSAIHRFLTDLVDDPDADVRREAIRSIGGTRRRELVPALIDRLDGADKEEAIHSLARYGDLVVGTLGDYLSDPAVPSERKRAIARVLSEIGTEEAVSALLRVPLEKDGSLPDGAIRALHRIRKRNRRLAIPAGVISPFIEIECGRYLRLVTQKEIVVKKSDRRAGRLMARLLTERSGDSLRRLFRILGLIYPVRETRLAYRGITSGNRRLRAQSIEYVESVLTAAHRKRVVPVVEASCDQTAPRSRGSLREILGEIALSDDTWAAACSLFVIGEERVSGLDKVVRDAARSSDPVVGEMGRWAARQAGGG